MCLREAPDDIRVKNHNLDILYTFRGDHEITVLFNLDTAIFYTVKYTAKSTRQHGKKDREERKKKEAQLTKQILENLKIVKKEDFMKYFSQSYMIQKLGETIFTTGEIMMQIWSEKYYVCSKDFVDLSLTGTRVFDPKELKKIKLEMVKDHENKLKEIERKNLERGMEAEEDEEEDLYHERDREKLEKQLEDERLKLEQERELLKHEKELRDEKKRFGNKQEEIASEYLDRKRERKVWAERRDPEFQWFDLLDEQHGSHWGELEAETCSLLHSHYKDHTDDMGCTDWAKADEEIQENEDLRDKLKRLGDEQYNEQNLNRGKIFINRLHQAGFLRHYRYLKRPEDKRENRKQEQEAMVPEEESDFYSR